MPSWLLIVLMLLCILVVQRRDAFSIDPLRALPAAGSVVMLGIAIAVGRFGMRPRLEAGATAFLQMTLFTVLGVVLAYALAANAGMLWDNRLAAADRAMGFDWASLRAGLDTLPPAVWLLGIAYHSLILQMIVAIVLLSALGRFDTLRTMVCAAILSGFVTILVSGVTPAMGNLFDPTLYRHLWPSVAWQEQQLIAGLRDGSLRSLDLTMLMGIVSFPSFHASLAAIFIWAFRTVPRFAIPGGGWAMLTIFATPIFGGHYAVDVLAGLILAPPAIIVARRLTQHAPAKLIGSASPA